MFFHGTDKSCYCLFYCHGIKAQVIRRRKTRKKLELGCTCLLKYKSFGLYIISTKLFPVIFDL